MSSDSPDSSDSKNNPEPSETSNNKGCFDVGLGTVIAVVVSYGANHSILWAIVHGLLGWIYLFYYAIVNHAEILKEIRDLNVLTEIKKIVDVDMWPSIVKKMVESLYQILFS